MTLDTSTAGVAVPDASESASQYDDRVRNLSRRFVYNVLPSVTIEDAPTDVMPPAADLLFERIRQGSNFKTAKLAQKQQDWCNLVHAATRANWLCGCIRYHRNREHIRQTALQVIGCAVEAGLFHEHRSPPGSPKTSRLIPLYELQRHLHCDPWDFDPPQSGQLVFLFTRDPPEELEFDPTLPVPADTQRRLQLINAVNAQCTITFIPFDCWAQQRDCVRRLRPVHIARFSESFDLHGRLYTHRYGHQSLRKIERETLEFDGEPSVELDYSAMHARLLYHLADIDCADDPYALWGAHTTESQRLLAKTVINATINARSAVAAVSACNNKTRLRTETGAWKQGRALESAQHLQCASRQSELTFKDVHALIMSSISLSPGSSDAIWEWSSCVSTAPSPSTCCSTLPTRGSPF